MKSHLNFRVWAKAHWSSWLKKRWPLESLLKEGRLVRGSSRQGIAVEGILMCAKEKKSQGWHVCLKNGTQFTEWRIWYDMCPSSGEHAWEVGLGSTKEDSLLTSDGKMKLWAGQWCNQSCILGRLTLWALGWLIADVTPAVLAPKLPFLSFSFSQAVKGRNLQGQRWTPFKVYPHCFLLEELLPSSLHFKWTKKLLSSEKMAN